MTTPDPKQKPQETLSPRIRRILAGLVGLLVVLAIVAMLFSLRRNLTPEEMSSEFYSSIQSLDGGALVVEFPISRTISAGAGLSEWLASIPSTGLISSVRADAVAIYAFDARADWDFAHLQDRLLIRAPAPELKNVLLQRDSIHIEANDEFPEEDLRLVREILLEKFPGLFRQEELASQPSRADALRAKLAEFARETLDTDMPMEVRLPGDSVLEESDSDEGP